jgi:hypothetical protein
VSIIKVSLLLFPPIFLFVANPVLAEVYQWQDEKGQTVFGDMPPKNKSVSVKNIESSADSGTRFADPEAVKNFNQKASQSRQLKTDQPERIDPFCRRYISQLNKVEIYLQHTKSPRDRQKAEDLRKLINRECSDNLHAQKFSDSYCDRYREDLKKTEIFLEHSNSPRDQNRADDLRKQIARECL